MSEAGSEEGGKRARLQGSGCGRLDGLTPDAGFVWQGWADPTFPGVCPRAGWKGYGPLTRLGGPGAGVTGALDQLAVTERVIT